MKIKLVMTPRSFIEEAEGMISIPPLGIAHLASFLDKKGYDVELDDLDIKVINDAKLFNELLDLQRKFNQNDLKNYLINNMPNPFLDKVTDLLLNKLDYKGYDVLGFSIIESSAIPFALLISKRIKKETGCKIVFGGESADPNIEKTYDFVDHIVYGPGEFKLLNVIYQLEKNSLIEKDNQNLFPKPMPVFKGLPFSCYRNMPEGSKFSNYGKILILPYIWSWGCPYKCSFCGSSLGSGKVFLKPVNQAIKELKELSNQYTKYFFLLNEYIHINTEHTKQLCQEIINKNLNIVWCGSARCNIDNNLLPAIYQSGGLYLFFGLESGSDNILKKMKKGYSAETAEKTIGEAHKAGIWLSISIIVGFPGETEEDFNQTFDFINKNQEYIDQLAVSPYYLVDSAVTREPEKFGIEIIKDIGSDKNAARERFSYNEINGYSWEELKKIKYRKLQKLLKLLYLYKKIPESVLRSSTYDLLYALSKFKDKKKALDFIKKLYHDRLRKEEFVLNITSLCNNNCLFCKKPTKIFEIFEDIKEKIKEVKARNIKRVRVSGGEPTIHPNLFEIIKLIKGEGLNLKLNTNARIFSYPAFCEEIYNTGLRTISVPIYSDKPKIHDNVTKVQGSLEQAIIGINNWEKLGGKIEIRTVLFKENKEDISKFVDFILKLETDPIF